MHSLTLLGGAFLNTQTDHEADIYWMGETSNPEESAKMEPLNWQEPASGARLFIVKIKPEFSEGTAYFS
jgi:hypothetical protein